MQRKSNFALLSFFIICLFSISVFADGMPFSPNLKLNLNAKESAQIAYIDVNSQGYSLDLFVNIADDSNQDFYWMVPLNEIPQGVSLSSYEKSGFSEKVSGFSQAMVDARRFQSAVSSAKPAFFIGQALTTPLAIPVLIISLFTITMSSAGLSSDSLSQYDFGTLGSAELYSLDNPKTLSEIFSSAGVSPDANLDAYLNKKVVLFKLKNPNGLISVVAHFDFNQNKSIYFPSGTTQFFKERPEKFGVMVKAPRDMVFENQNEIKPAKTLIGKNEQLMLFLANSNSFGYERDTFNTQTNVWQDAIVSKDILLKSTGKRAITFSEILAGSNPLGLGVLVGLILLAIGVIIILKLKNELGFFQFINGALLCFGTIIGISIAIVELIMILTILQSLIINLSYIQNYIFQLIIVLIPLLVMGVILFLLARWIDKATAGVSSSNFSKKDILIVLIITSVLNIIIGLIIVFL